MNPLEIVKKTPGNNCGECGYPACLAFAANVAKSGEDPHKCPYIELSGLELPTGDKKNLAELAEEKERELINHLKSKIRGMYLPGIADNLGASFHPDNNSLSFIYLGQQVMLTAEEITINNQVPEDHRDQILLYNYIHYQGKKPATNNWIGLESLPNSISKVRTLATYAEEPLAKVFTGMTGDGITKICSRVGGSPISGTTATAAMEIKVLPNLPQQVYFWDEEPEDGFASKVKILYDENVLDYLDIESLVFSSERMTDRFVSIHSSHK